MQVALVFLVQLYLLFPLHRVIDIPQWDESNYMGMGGAFLLDPSHLTGAANCPLYTLFYAAAIACAGRIGSIFLMHYALKIGTTMALLLVCRRMMPRSLLALVIPLVWAVSSYNLHTTLLVYHAAFLFFLLAVAASDRSRVLTLLLLVCAALVRLEYLLAVAGYASLWLLRALRARGRAGGAPSPAASTGVRAGVVATALLALFVIVKIDSWALGGGRTFFAFKQHFALRLAEEGRFDASPWIDFPVLIEATFGDAQTLGGAIAANPGAVARHVALNMRDLVPTVVKGLAATGPQRPLAVIVCIVLVLGLACIASCWKRFGPVAGWVHPGRLDVCLAGALTVLPGLLVYPKVAYSLGLVPLVLFFFAEGWRRTGATSRSTQWVEVGMALALLAGAVALPPPFRTAAHQPFLANVKFVESALPPGRPRMMGIVALSYVNYIGPDRCEPVELFTDEALHGHPRKYTVQELIEKHRPDVVMVNGELVRSALFDPRSLIGLDQSDWTCHAAFDLRIYVAPE